MNQLTFLWEEPHANHSRKSDCELDWQTLVATSCLPLAQLLADTNPNGWFGKMSPVSCHLEKDGILEPSLGCWQTSGMGSPTGFLTLTTSVAPSNARVCLLSDILETGEKVQQYCLSEKVLKLAQRELSEGRAVMFSRRPIPEAEMQEEILSMKEHIGGE